MGVGVDVFTCPLNWTGEEMLLTNRVLRRTLVGMDTLLHTHMDFGVVVGCPACEQAAHNLATTTVDPRLLAMCGDR